VEELLRHKADVNACTTNENFSRRHCAPSGL
jgi:hypothetical protein